MLFWTVLTFTAWGKTIQNIFFCVPEKKKKLLKWHEGEWWPTPFRNRAWILYKLRTKVNHETLLFYTTRCSSVIDVLPLIIKQTLKSHLFRAESRFKLECQTSAYVSYTSVFHNLQHHVGMWNVKWCHATENRC